MNVDAWYYSLKCAILYKKVREDGDCVDIAIQAELVEITNKIAETLDIEQIYLFGSYVYGNPHEDSDFDIYVIIPDGSIRCLEAMQKIGKALFNIQKRPIDILVGEASTFERKSKELSIERTVKREGIILYDKQPVYAMA